ncbi:transglutaminase-like domain-containing protein [Clostridium sp. MSJ-4]|uniref:Transglutaminase-like domain-containing protein n=1 Tax=Clostridium simiarum TaxID=2841506 RepID=A0ABS6EYX4_9CLOT|nr:transglutaminase-like domain-containing protein [Clostridium simiarum]MBU5590603.1 transglutaminase-like domain-containing protein [Clostridium simiarum]
MEKNSINLLFILMFLYPLLKGFIFKFDSLNLKEGLIETEKNIAFLLSIPISVYLMKYTRGYLDTFIKKTPYSVMYYIEKYNKAFYVIVFLIICFIIYSIQLLIYNLLNYLIFYPLIRSLENKIKYKGSTFNRIIGAIFSIPKGVCYVFFTAFFIYFLSYFYKGEKLNYYLESSSIYNKINISIMSPLTNSNLVKQIPEIIKDSFKVEIKQNPSNVVKGKNNKENTIVYYNGVTLEEGIKSSEYIDNFSINLVKGYNNDKAKAKAIYNWIGLNINYDYEKVDKVYNNDFKVDSGAKVAYDTKEGICFDFSCLFVAMCRATGLKVRLVTGEGFNGLDWVSHSWNQVYISEEDRWINVDTTFYRGGNYFNSKKFDLDHRGENIIGEW